MKKLICGLVVAFGLYGCATPNTQANKSYIDANNDYSSTEVNSPNVGSRAYSGAEFPSENKLTNMPKKPTASAANTM